MLKIAVIIGSTRPGRVGDSVAKWASELAKKRTDAANHCQCRRRERPKLLPPFYSPFPRTQTYFGTVV